MDSDLILSNVINLVGYINKVTDAVNSLINAWDILASDYQTVILQVNNVDPTASDGFIIKANLESAKTDWDALNSDAENIKNKFADNLPVDDSQVKNAIPGQPNLPIIVRSSPSAKDFININD
eukprot:gene3177-4323_t